MNNFDFNKSKAKLGDISARHTALHKECSQLAIEELKANLKPGETLPKIKGIATQTQREAYQEKSRALSSEAFEELDKIQAHIDAVKAEAPSQDAVNYISMLALRARPTQTDIETATRAYGGNYNCMKTINDIAVQHGLAPMGFDPVSDMEAFVQAESRHARSYGTGAFEDSSGWAARDSFTAWFRGDSTEEGEQ